MARPLRLEFSGALYHITSRGDHREDIFMDDVDRQSFLNILGQVCARTGWICHAYCLMDNHYHLVIETPKPNLSKGMRQLNGVYTQAFNRRHDRVGHVFQGRYKAIIVDRDRFLLDLCSYVVLNPVRTGKVRSAVHWRWSSYRAVVGRVACPVWLDCDSLLGASLKQRRQAKQAYAQVVKQSKDLPNIWEHLRNQIYLGDAAFVRRMQHKLKRRKKSGDLSEIPRIQREPPPKPLEYYTRRYRNRNRAITAAYDSGQYSLKAIGDHFGLHYTTISRIVKQSETASDD
jgi:putative transposase